MPQLPAAPQHPGMRDSGHDRKYGGARPGMHHGQCQITDIAMKANGMTAKMIYTGQMNATGTVETT